MARKYGIEELGLFRLSCKRTEEKRSLINGSVEGVD